MLKMVGVIELTWHESLCKHFFGEVSCIYWLGLQGQQADLVVPDYTIIYLDNVVII